MTENLTAYCGDARAILPTLEPESVQCCVTSPPYWGLRDYGTATWEGGAAECDHANGFARRDKGRLSIDDRPGVNPSPVDTPTYFRDTCPKCGARRIDSQLGLEATPEEYVANMVAVFREVWRVLREDGTLWLNLGDTMLPDKNEADIPHLVKLGLKKDDWICRSTIIWHKPNPMPESVTDRPTKSHEYIFLLTKNGGKPLIWRARDTGEWSYNPDLSETLPRRAIKASTESWKGSSFDDGKTADHQLNRSSRGDEDEEIPRWKGFDYYYDVEAIRETALRPEGSGNINPQFISNQRSGKNANLVNGLHKVGPREFRNKRTVWTIATQPYSEAHFATFPEEIPKLCILAGTKPGDTVLDSFAGSGTVGKVALELGRRAILIELNPDYIALAWDRTFVTPGFF